MFADRKDAGSQLAEALYTYSTADPLVAAVPPGGVEVGFRIARRLEAELTLLIVRRLRFPAEPEKRIGALAEDGSLYINEKAQARVSPEMCNDIITRQQKEISRRAAVLRKEPFPDVQGRTVILADEGIATGSTVRTALMMLRNKGASPVVTAVPVAAKDTLDEIAPLTDDLIVLEIPAEFRGIAQVYRNRPEVTDREVKDIMESLKRVRS